MNKRDIILSTSSKALELRRKASIGYLEAVCIYDLAVKLGVDVWFQAIPSMEGIYYKNRTPVILISSLRPQGRKAFTCAHELGHHIYKHGGRVDVTSGEHLYKNRSDPDESLVDNFASFLLMPKTTVLHAFAIRGWANLEACQPIQVFTVAGWLGVGYETLIYHMWLGLNIITKNSAERLLKTSPKQIRDQVLGVEVSGNLVVVDNNWHGKAIDIEVGDIVVLPNGTISEGNQVRLWDGEYKGCVFYGNKPGIGRFENLNAQWSAFVRVSRKGYIGRSVFRHLEEPEDEE